MDRTKSRGAMWGLLALVVTIGLMGSALAGGSALAARGGVNATESGPSLTVSPNPVPNGSASITISGSGFRANQTLSEVGVWGVIPSYMVVTDGNGSFSLTFTSAGGPFWEGSYAAVAANFKGHRLVTLASTNFTVCSTNPC